MKNITKILIIALVSLFAIGIMMQAVDASHTFKQGGYKMTVSDKQYKQLLNSNKKVKVQKKVISHYNKINVVGQRTYWTVKDDDYLDEHYKEYSLSKYYKNGYKYDTAFTKTYRKSLGNGLFREYEDQMVTLKKPVYTTKTVYKRVNPNFSLHKIVGYTTEKKYVTKKILIHRSIDLYNKNGNMYGCDVKTYNKGGIYGSNKWKHSGLRFKEYWKNGNYYMDTYQVLKSAKPVVKKHPVEMIVRKNDYGKILVSLYYH